MKTGTRCIVIYTHKSADKFLGKECVVTGHTDTDELGHHLTVRFNDGTNLLAADKCLMPLDPPTEQEKTEATEAA